MNIRLPQFPRFIRRHDAAIRRDHQCVGGRCGIAFQFRAHAAQHFGIGSGPIEMQRLRRRPVAYGGAAQLILAQVQNEVSEAVTSEPE